MKGSPIRYSDQEMTWLEANRLLPIGDYHRLFVGTFKREVAASALNGLRQRRGWKTGRTGQFEKGCEPMNKGKTCAPGVGGRHPNAQRTQFKKGARPHTYRGPGHERIDSKDGYVVLIVAEPNPWTGAATRPVHKHRWLWEKANGPIPKGFALKCLDGDKTNCDPSNWEMIPRALLPHLGGRRGFAYDQAHPDLKPTIMAVSRLKHAAAEARKRAGRGQRNDETSR